MKHEPNKKVSAEEISQAIDSWIVGRNAERNRQILKRRLIDGIGYEHIGFEFDMSTTQIKNIVYRESDKIFKQLGW